MCALSFVYGLHEAAYGATDDSQPAWLEQHIADRWGKKTRRYRKDGSIMEFRLLPEGFIVWRNLGLELARREIST